MNFNVLGISVTILSAILGFYIMACCHKTVRISQKIMVFYIWFITLIPMCLLILEMKEESNFKDSSSEVSELNYLSQLWLAYYYLNFFILIQTV